MFIWTVGSAIMPSNQRSVQNDGLLKYESLTSGVLKLLDSLLLV